MATKITQAVIKRAKPKRKAYEIRGQQRLILRIQPTGRKVFYCQYARNKRMKIGDALVLTVERAEYLARDILQEAHDFDEPLARDLRKATLGDFIQHDYAPWLQANRRRADRTLAMLKSEFGYIYSKRLSEITRLKLDAHVAENIAQGRTATTIVRRLNDLRTAIRLAMERGYLRENPFRGWRKPKVDDKGITRYLTAAEEKALRDKLIERDDQARRERVSNNDWRRARSREPLPEFGEKDFPDHLTPLTLLSLNTGMRFGELAQLEWSAIDFPACNLTVTGRTSKGARTRHIPLNAEALDVLQRWRAQHPGPGLLFKNSDGAVLGTVRNGFKRMLKDAGISNFRWHDLRHTFASKLVQRGVDLVVVRELLGHSDFSLTLRYSHLGPRQKVDAVAKLATP